MCIRHSCLTTRTPRARRIACSRCGRSSIAPPVRRPWPIRRAARTIFSVGRAYRLRRLQWQDAAWGYTGEGSTATEFFNVQAGDAPYLKVARRRIYDERQPSPGGPRRHRREITLLGTGDAIWFSNGAGARESRRTILSIRRIRAPRCPAIPPLCRKSKTRTRSRGRTTSIPRTATPVGQPRSGVARPKCDLRRRCLCQLRRLHPARRRAVTAIPPR